MWQILLSFRVLSFCELLIFFYKGLLIHSVGQVIRMSLNVHVCTQGTIIFHEKFAKLEGLPLTVDIGWIAREDMSVPWRWMVTQFSAVRNHISPPWATFQAPCPDSTHSEPSPSPWSCPRLWPCQHSLHSVLSYSLPTHRAWWRCMVMPQSKTGYSVSHWADPPNSPHKENKDNVNLLVAYTMGSNRELAASSDPRSRISEPKEIVVPFTLSFHRGWKAAVSALVTEDLDPHRRPTGQQCHFLAASLSKLLILLIACSSHLLSTCHMSSTVQNTLYACFSLVLTAAQAVALLPICRWGTRLAEVEWIADIGRSSCVKLHSFDTEDHVIMGYHVWYCFS